MRPRRLESSTGLASPTGTLFSAYLIFQKWLKRSPKKYCRHLNRENDETISSLIKIPCRYAKPVKLSGVIYRPPCPHPSPTLPTQRALSVYARRCSSPWRCQLPPKSRHMLFSRRQLEKRPWRLVLRAWNTILNLPCTLSAPSGKCRNRPRLIEVFLCWRAFDACCGGVSWVLWVTVWCLDPTYYLPSILRY